MRFAEPFGDRGKEEPPSVDGDLVVAMMPVTKTANEDYITIMGREQLRKALDLAEIYGWKELTFWEGWKSDERDLEFPLFITEYGGTQKMAITIAPRIPR